MGSGFVVWRRRVRVIVRDGLLQVGACLLGLVAYLYAFGCSPGPSDPNAPSSNGGPNNPAPTSTVGPAGGNVSLPTGAGTVSADIPAGVFQADTTFQIAEWEPPAPAPQGLSQVGEDAYRITSSSTTFLGEVDITAPIAGGIQPDTAYSLMQYNEEDDSWERIPSTVDEGAETLSGPIDHPTTVSVFARQGGLKAVAGAYSGLQTTYLNTINFENTTIPSGGELHATLQANGTFQGTVRATTDSYWGSQPDPKGMELGISGTVSALDGRITGNSETSDVVLSGQFDLISSDQVTARGTWHYEQEGVITDGDWVAVLNGDPLAIMPTPLLCAMPQYTDNGSPSSYEWQYLFLAILPDTSIRYTLDGSTPSRTHGTPYTPPVVGQSGNPSDDQYIAIQEDTRLKAIAFKEGMVDSNVYTAVIQHYPRSATLSMVSVDNHGCQQYFGDSYFPSMSDNGRHVAFVFYGALVVHDRQDRTGRGIPAGGYGPTISADGKHVAFMSEETTLVDNDTNGEADVFVYDVDADSLVRVSVDSSGVEGNGNSGADSGCLLFLCHEHLSAPSISAHGRYVAFKSYATNLVAGDNNDQPDVFVHDTTTGATERISVSSSGAEADGESFSPSMSAGGRLVAFVSDANNLVANDLNGEADVFVHDRQTGETTRISVSTGGSEANAASRSPHISGDGRYVAFASEASNLVTGDTNERIDVFVHDRDTGVTTRVSVSSTGAQGDEESLDPCLSFDGRYVAFISEATNLVAGDTNGIEDAFLHDRSTATTTRVTSGFSGDEPNGRIRRFRDLSSYMIAQDRERPRRCSISGDGRYVAFQSIAKNLVIGDNNGAWDVFVYDRDAE